MLLAEITHRRKKIEKHRNAISAIQKNCEHPLAMRDSESRADTGNYDYSDKYWTEHYCNLCDKRWRTDKIYE